MKAGDLIKVLKEAKQIIPQDLVEMAATGGESSNNGTKRMVKGWPTKKRFNDPYSKLNGRGAYR